MMLLMQLVARQILSFISINLQSILGKETLQHKSVGHLSLSFWVAGNQSKVTVWRVFCWKQTMPGINKAFHDLLVFDYILLHHLYNLQRIRYAVRYFVKNTLERRGTNVSLSKVPVIFFYFEKTQNTHTTWWQVFRAVVGCCA